MKPGWGKIDYSPETVAYLASCKRSVVAAILVEATELELPGTRSQRLTGKATVMASSDESLGSGFPIYQYWGGDIPLQASSSYVAILCLEEGFEKNQNVAGSVRVIQWEKIKAAEAKKRVELEAKNLATALKRPTK